MGTTSERPPERARLEAARRLRATGSPDGCTIAWGAVHRACLRLGLGGWITARAAGADRDVLSEAIEDLESPD